MTALRRLLARLFRRPLPTAPRTPLEWALDDEWDHEYTPPADRRLR